MSQLSNSTDSPTDAYSMPQATTPAKSGLSTNQKKLLAISSATLLMGGAAWAITRGPGKSIDTTSPTDSDPAGSTNGASTSTQPVALPTDIDASGKVGDTMSFEQAFETARKEVGVGGVFSWHGRWYNTFEKEEWSSLSLEQRQEFTEMITQEELPVRPYRQTVAGAPATHSSTEAAEPTIIEGHLNGQRVMGLDFDQDGVIDTLVMEGADGYTYRIVDARGDDGLDTIMRFDSLNGELVEIERIDKPFVLSNDQFSQGLEASMGKEVVDSILEPELVDPTPAPAAPADDHLLNETEGDDDTVYLADSHEPDDTYVNDGDVHDMDE
ncbi:hypothetical protein [Spirosoma sp.]|uniref:hypothetical protein n=1 Tax=Spirosoma sp. TaxID=1899569 RepID=UPI0026242F38|nr:hypothetical protein [Spirosoma sp.]MCX6215441.1 hypothetical protein [Spirosoma sp.]